MRHTVTIRLLPHALLPFVTLAVTFAQAEVSQHTLAEIVALRMEEALYKEPRVSGSDMVRLSENPEEALPAIESYFADPEPRVRLEAITLYGVLAAERVGPELRQTCVEKLVEELGVWLDAPVPERPLAYDIASELMRFSAPDFTPEAKRGVLAFLTKIVERKAWEEGQWHRNAILVSGVAGLDEARPFLSEIIELDKVSERFDSFSSSRWGASLTWSAMLASARIYESEDIQRCIDKVNRGSVQSKVKKAQDLVYIGRPEIVEYLLPFTESDEIYAHSMPDDTIASRAYGLITMILPDMAWDVRIQAEALQEQWGRPIETEEVHALNREWLEDRANWQQTQH